MRKLLPLLAATMLSSHAWALDQCVPSQEDSQVRMCVYNPMQRYVVNGVVGVPTNLRFSPDEVVKRVEFSYSGEDKDKKPAPTWKGPDEKKIKDSRLINNLPLWPFHSGRSSLIVATATQDGSERTYLFELNASSDEQPNTTAALMFVYPDDTAKKVAKETEEKKKAQLVVWRAKQAKKSEDDAIARLRVDPFYGDQNPAYQAKGDPAYKYLAPSQVTDNGWLTEMTWPENEQIPTVTILNKTTGEERIPAMSQQGRMLIINGTSEWFRLRLGPKAVIDVHNLHWSPVRPDPQTGTTSSDVVRQVIYKDGR